MSNICHQKVLLRSKMGSVKDIFLKILLLREEVSADVKKNNLEELYHVFRYRPI